MTRAHGEAGISLIEALVAGGVLATGVLALAQVIAFSAAAVTAARQVTVATTLAAQKIEELRAGPFATGSGTDQVDEYRRAWQVTADADDPADTLAVVVTVSPGGVQIVTRRTRWTR